MPSWDFDFLTHCVKMSDKMRKQINDNMINRGDRRRNDEENKACEIFTIYADRQFRQRTEFILQDFYPMKILFRPTVCYLKPRRGRY